jgi:hypothetical protein
MEQAKRLNIHGSYFRFDVPQGMSTIGLEDWEKLKDMIALTTQYNTRHVKWATPPFHSLKAVFAKSTSLSKYIQIT